MRGGKWEDIPVSGSVCKGSWMEMPMVSIEIEPT